MVLHCCVSKQHVWIWERKSCLASRVLGLRLDAQRGQGHFWLLVEQKKGCCKDVLKRDIEIGKWPWCVLSNVQKI